MLVGLNTLTRAWHMLLTVLGPVRHTWVFRFSGMGPLEWILESWGDQITPTLKTINKRSSSRSLTGSGLDISYAFCYTEAAAFCELALSIRRLARATSILLG